MTDDNWEAAKRLSEAMIKYGKVYSYYYRPSKKCFKAGFLYTLGGIVAVTLTLGAVEVWKWII